MVSQEMDRRAREGAPGLRILEAADIDTVVEFANRVQAPYAGMAIRTVEDFTWRCLDRPGVEREGRFLAEVGGRIAGFAVVRNTGEVLECVVDRRPDAAEVLDALVAAAERYARSVGARRLLVNLPTDRPDLARVAAASGFSGSTATNLYVAPKDLARLVGRLATATGAGGRCDIGFDVRSPFESERLRFRMKRGTVTTDGHADAAIQVVIDRQVLSSILFGRRSALLSVLKGYVAVRPVVMTPVVAKVLRSLSVRAPWYFNRSDIL